MVCRAADRLGHLCAALHLTPTEFAARLALPPARARRILTTPRAPSLKLMARVQRAFPELSPQWLLSGEGEMLAPAATAGNHIGINYGHCSQTIYYACSMATTAILQAQLREKERTIQILLTQFPHPFPQTA